MQSPTHPQLYIRNEHDAHVVMEAVRLGRLPMVTHRLSTHERLRFLQPGAVFVWEEAEAGTRGVGGKGMERWTDGLKWSPSRSNDPFLLYEEKAEQLTAEELRDR
ncbi:hypothetical protein CALVIDRAFT_540939 [Calocera viscosa TUFC12733]|uniref:Gti1/Pac2 family-domain-containing protein n=1 Tax=Calocera viscosa (strain TUFC12733) TaxID=1330018 RepID=A0A167IBL1_CALVF|nr:hypothetical protein CALVIDRAFT_540939 [Calocera viscosa TUFC12733]